MEIPEGAVYAVIQGDGDIWEQQCGGFACDQKSAKGKLKQLAGGCEESKLLSFFTGEKWRGWCTDGIDADTADYIEATIPVFAVDRNRLNESCEAWIIGTLHGKPAVLVWGNSD